MPSVEELIAHNSDEAEIAGKLKCEWVLYQDLEDLEEAIKSINPAIKTFDTSCFSGEYVTGDVNAEYFERLQAVRADTVFVCVASTFVLLCMM